MSMMLKHTYILKSAGRCLRTPSRSPLIIPSWRCGANIHDRNFSSDSSSSSSFLSLDDIKFQSKTTTTETKTSAKPSTSQESHALHDTVEHATGIEKKQLLSQLRGDIRYEPTVYQIRGGTKEDPMVVPSEHESRIVGCICEPDQLFVNYMSLRKGEPKSCACGYWFKLVEAPADVF